MKPDLEMIKLGWRCQCPKCRSANIYEPGITMQLRKTCPECGLKISACDTADGPAVFLIFILGTLLVPLAIAVEFAFQPPLWLHITVWSTLSIACTLGLLRQVKAYIIALQFKHRPESFK